MKTLLIIGYILVFALYYQAGVTRQKADSELLHIGRKHKEWKMMVNRIRANLLDRKNLSKQDRKDLEDLEI